MKNQTKLNQVNLGIALKGAFEFSQIEKKPPFDILYARKPKNPI